MVAGSSIMKAIAIASIAALLCCSMFFLPALSFSASPPRKWVRWTAAPLVGRSPRHMWDHNRASPGEGFYWERRRRKTIFHARHDHYYHRGCLLRSRRASWWRCHRPKGVGRPHGRTATSRAGLGWRLSSLRSDDDAAFKGEDDKTMSFEEFKKAFVLSSPGGDGGEGAGGDDGVQQGDTRPAAGVGGGGGGGATGIRWRSLAGDVLAQPLFFSVFALLSTPAIREKVRLSFSLTLSGAGLGVLASLPLFAIGYALETRRRDWAWVRAAEATTERAVVDLFGNKRQVAKVSAVAIPLAILVGLSEEFGFRGFLPLIVADKTGLPTAAVIVLSGIFCGLFHAVSWAYFINASLNGMFFHGLLLSTGNIAVPVVAHAVHNAFALVHCHVKTSRPPNIV